MTITNLKQVYGIRLKRCDFYKWIIESKYDEWYKIILNYFEKDEEEINNFYKALQEENIFDTKYCDDFHFLFDDLDINYNSNYDNFKLRVLSLTHDTCDFDIVIGIITSEINLFVSIINKIDPEYQLPFVFSNGYYSYNNSIEEMKQHPIFKDKELKMYLVQDDCECCS